MAVTLLSTQIPAYQVPPAAPDTLSAGEGTAVVAPNFVASDVFFREDWGNPITAILESVSCHGAGLIGIAEGLAISAGAGLTLNIAAGRALLGGERQIAATTKTMPDNQARVFVWLKQDGTPTYKTDTSVPTGVCCLLGSCVTNSPAGSITGLDSSGVQYVRNGIVYRETADTGAPADTIPASAFFMAKTAGGLFPAVNGSYWQMSPSAGGPFVRADGTVPMAADLSLSGYALTNVAYVDTAVVKKPVRLVTAAAPSPYTRTGSVITFVSNGSQSVDGSATVLNDDVMLQHGAAGSDNWIYTVTTKGDGSTKEVWTRRTDSDSANKVARGFMVWALDGTVNKGFGFRINNTGAITLNTTAITIERVTDVVVVQGGGSPEGAITAPVGRLYSDTTNGKLYIKATGTGNTGWTQLIVSGAGVSTQSAETATIQVANTGTETSLVSAILLQGTNPAVGKTWRIRASGPWGTKAAAPGTGRLKLKYGSTVILDTGAQTPAANMTNDQWWFEGEITVRANGAGGNVFAQGRFYHGDGTTSNLYSWNLTNTAVVNIDFTVSTGFDMTWQWQTADTANDLRRTNLTIEALN